MPEGMNRLDQLQSGAEFFLAGYPTNREQRTILRIDSKHSDAVMLWVARTKSAVKCILAGALGCSILPENETWCCGLVKGKVRIDCL